MSDNNTKKKSPFDLFSDLLTLFRFDLDFKVFFGFTKKYLKENIAELNDKINKILALEAKIGKSDESDQLLRELREEKEFFVKMFIRKLREEKKLQKRYEQEWLDWVCHVIAETLLRLSQQDLLSKLQELQRLNVTAAVLIHMTADLVKDFHNLQVEYNTIRNNILSLPLNQDNREKATKMLDTQKQLLDSGETLAKSYHAHAQDLYVMEQQSLIKEHQQRSEELKAKLFTNVKELHELKNRLQGINNKLSEGYSFIVSNSDCNKGFETFHYENGIKLSEEASDIRDKIRRLEQENSQLTNGIKNLKRDIDNFSSKPTTPTSNVPLLYIDTTTNPKDFTPITGQGFIKNKDGEIFFADNKKGAIQLYKLSNLYSESGGIPRFFNNLSFPQEPARINYQSLNQSALKEIKDIATLHKPDIIIRPSTDTDLNNDEPKSPTPEDDKPPYKPKNKS